MENKSISSDFLNLDNHILPYESNGALAQTVHLYGEVFCSNYRLVWSYTDVIRAIHLKDIVKVVVSKQQVGHNGEIIDVWCLEIYTGHKDRDWLYFRMNEESEMFIKHVEEKALQRH